jgi:hypothetical protein
MYPYLAMLALPSGLALASPRARRLALLLVALLYFLMIGFRFQVGMDWNNYIYIFQSKRALALPDLIFAREPGYGLLMWIAAQLGLGMLFVNAVSGLVFCWGFFAVAKRCGEPWLAIAIATPLLAVAFAMSGVRQAIAAGIIFYLMAHWDEHRTLVRMLLVGLASLFHFSSIFIMMFVALGSNASAFLRIGGAVLIGIFTIVLIRWAPEAVEAYSRLYVGSEGKISAPGAIFQLAPLVVAALIYFANRQRWIVENRESKLYHNMAWASLLAVPAIPLSSVGVYRFALYFWPMAMHVYGDLPPMIESPTGRLFYRLSILTASFALLVGWLMLANNSFAWIPYRNWLIEPNHAILLRHWGV